MICIFFGLVGTTTCNAHAYYYIIVIYISTLVTLMLANNEVGSINPMKDISNYCHTNNILIHIDAAQAVGKVNMKMGTDDDSIIGMHCDMMTIVGHKIGAPKGIACLYIQSNIMKQYILNNKIDGALLGGGQGMYDVFLLFFVVIPPLSHKKKLVCFLLFSFFFCSSFRIWFTCWYRKCTIYCCIRESM